MDWSEILWDKGHNKKFQPNNVNRDSGIQFLKGWLPSSQLQNMLTERWYNSGQDHLGKNFNQNNRRKEDQNAAIADPTL